ncbi:SRPBCC family protein [Sphingomonas aracearum]|uniref:SRPBCC family protein n=1 Tax=Sphingomonas aracearum TaxID=2283317 RepID=A0A369VYG3_9SPHN|nr:SRPBCC family protein [Sphingomonas aracearum]RDE06665.1 SRPBCC family protein [Sphingomonas aracearum]
MFGKILIGGCVLVFAGVFGMGTRLTSGLTGGGGGGDSVTVAAPISEVYAAVDDVSLSNELGQSVNLGSHGTVNFSQTREVGKSYTIHATRGSEALADIEVSLESTGDKQTELTVAVTRHELAGGEELPLLFRENGLLEAAAEKQVAHKLQQVDPRAAERLGFAYARNQARFKIQLASAMGNDPAGTTAEMQELGEIARDGGSSPNYYRDNYRNQSNANVSAGRPMLEPQGSTPHGMDPTPPGSTPY